MITDLGLRHLTRCNIRLTPCVKVPTVDCNTSEAEGVYAVTSKRYSLRHFDYTTLTLLRYVYTLYGFGQAIIHCVNTRLTDCLSAVIVGWYTRSFAGCTERHDCCSFAPGTQRPWLLHLSKWKLSTFHLLPSSRVMDQTPLI